MKDDQDEDNLGTARGIMNAIAMALLIWTVASLLAIYAVGWS